MTKLLNRRRSDADSWFLAVLILGASLLPTTVPAEDLKTGVPVSLISESASGKDFPVYQADEIYGLAMLAAASEKYRPDKADKKTCSDTSFIVAGEVSNPGEYCLGSPVNLLTAVLAAGGPSLDGSMRRIEVYQSGTLLGEFDLYGFLSEGQIADDFIFNGGEQIVVLPRGPRVSVSGSVNTPAAFELKAGEMELGKVLLLAGGFSSGSGSHRIEVVRISDSKRLTVFSAEVHSGADIPAFSLESGDRIYVSRISSGAEKVYMQLPGQPRRDIAYRPNIRVSDLIAALNPLPENVALNYAEVLREGRSDKKYDVIGISIDVLLQQIKAGDMSQDLIMRPGDRLMLFDREFLDKKPVVGLEIKGQPLMLIDFKPGMKISDLLECSNLMLPSGKLRANIHRRQLNGSRLDVVSLVVELNAVRRRNQRQDIELQPFDTLMIQR